MRTTLKLPIVRMPIRLANTIILTTVIAACQPSTNNTVETARPDTSNSIAKVQPQQTQQGMQEVMLANFEDGKVPSFVKMSNGDVKIVDGEGATNPGKALNVRLHSKDNWAAALNLEPSTPWNWSQYFDFHIAFDIANHGSESTQIDLIMSDKNGDSYTRTLVVPVGGVKTYYAKMDGHDQTHPDGTAINEFNFISGLRSNPPTWESDDIQVHSLWGNKRLYLGGITKIQMGANGYLSDREFTIDNIRLRPNPEMNPDFLVGLLDEFGQNTRIDYAGKVKDLDQLKQASQSELESLQGERLADRSKFHGWKNGPKFEGTGNFRTKKVDGKWWLIDPEGYLYLSTGVDIIRLSNSSTITGYDFDPSKIGERDVNEIISEDDQTLNRVSEDAQKTRKLVSQERANMFNWLPSYEDELGNHFGYRREVQSGPLKHGETFSFYSANLERKYGETYERSYMDKWREVTLKRMQDWGFTSLGNWAEQEYYAKKEIPFVAFADINGDYGTVSSGFDFWHPLPDPYDPVFYERALVSAEFVADQIKDSPWCMGIFYDNEQSFGRIESDELHWGIVIDTLKKDAKEVHAKAAFADIMKDKYQTIEALNTAWNKKIASWDAFYTGIESTIETDTQRQDYSDLLQAFGEQYFGSIRKATKSVLPNHLYLGARMADWGRPEEIVRAAAKHADIISFNLYKEGVKDSHYTILDEVDKPTLIGEFSFGSDDAGHIHPGLVLAADQNDRGRKFTNFMNTVIDNKYFVGAHMFQYMDGPITGRAYDGENYNMGMVSITDTPYKPMVEAAKKVHKNMYSRRYGSDPK